MYPVVHPEGHRSTGKSNEDLRLGGFNSHVNHRLDSGGHYFELDGAISDRAQSLVM